MTFLDEWPSWKTTYGSKNSVWNSLKMRKFSKFFVLVGRYRGEFSFVGGRESNFNGKLRKLRSGLQRFAVGDDRMADAVQ